MLDHHPMWIDGAATDGVERMTLVNPADEQPFATVPSGDAAAVDVAVAAARRAFEAGAWPAMPAAERAQRLQRLADLIERDAATLAGYDARSIGRPIYEPTLLDLPHVIDCWRYFAGWADKITGETVPVPGYMGRPLQAMTVREPVGVVGMITPWNTPLMILSWKLAPALAAGCTAVIKPSEETPLSALHLARLAAEVGIPEGVVNVVTGPGETAGAALAKHPGIDKISFTGSPEVGAEIAHAAAANCTRVALELGGKSPQIVFPDADLDAAAQGCAMGLFFNHGQVCAAGSRILAHVSIRDALAERLVAIAATFQPGDPMNPATRMGSLAGARHHARVSSFVEETLAAGATLLTGGAGKPERGYHFAPTLFGDVTPDMRIAREEVFGPVGALMSFETEEEAIALANATRYGLAATIWTASIATAFAVAGKLRVGAVGINAWSPIDPRLPWGGSKASGVGRECGRSGLLAYTEEKVIALAL